MLSWGNHHVKPVQGSIRPPEYTRTQHLESYLNDDTLKPSTRRVSADDSTYDTVFQTVTKTTLILRVHLPPSQGRPAMTLVGVKARHEWLDRQMQVIGYEAIQSEDNWRQERILLATAVHQVIQQFQLNPPEIIEITDRGLKSIQPPPEATPPATQTPKETAAPPTYEDMLTSNSDHSLRLPQSIDEIDCLNREQIDELLEDELKFLAFCHKLDFVKNELLPKNTELIGDNVKKATENLNKQYRVRTLHGEVQELQRTLKSKVEQFLGLQRQQDAICAPPDERLVIKQLTRAKREAFDESEKIAEGWLEDGGKVEDFCERFLEKRKLHHARAAKLELLTMYP